MRRQRLLRLITLPTLGIACRTGHSLPAIVLEEPAPVAALVVPRELLAAASAGRRLAGDPAAPRISIDGPPQHLRGLPSLRYVIDGELLPAGTAERETRAEARLNALEPANLLEVTLLRRAEAVARYGPEIGDGVIIIRTRAGAADARPERRGRPRPPAG